MHPEDFIITRKRKKYRFAKFAQFLNCFELGSWVFPDEWVGHTTLEIGAGTGLFSVELARRHPDQFFIAMDVKADRLQKGAEQALDGGLTNIVFIRGHLAYAKELIPAHSLRSVWITFPDPYAKKRSAKHRLTHPVFLQQYRNMLKKTGSLLCKTDNAALFCWSLEQLVMTNWRLKELSFDLHASDRPADYKILTTYEQRFLAEGLQTHLVVATPS